MCLVHRSNHLITWLCGLHDSPRLFVLKCSLLSAVLNTKSHPCVQLVPLLSCSPTTLAYFISSPTYIQSGLSSPRSTQRTAFPASWVGKPLQCCLPPAPALPILAPFGCNWQMRVPAASFPAVVTATSPNIVNFFPGPTDRWLTKHLGLDIHMIDMQKRVAPVPTTTLGASRHSNLNAQWHSQQGDSFCRDGLLHLCSRHALSTSNLQ